MKHPKVSNEIPGPIKLFVGDLLGMKYYPAMWGLE